jgi:hypothetical protein
MSVARLRAGLCAASVIVAAACGDNSGTNPPEPPVTAAPPTLDVLSGNGQTSLVNTTLPQQLQVLATASNGHPMAGVTVNFAVTSGSATLSAPSAVTDGSGVARVTVTLGATPGTVIVTATVSGTPTLTTTFTLAAGTGTIVTACTGGAAQTPAVGAVISSIAGTGVCLGGGTSGAQYALVAFNSNQDSVLASQATFSVRGSNITSVTTADLAPLNADAAAGSPFAVNVAQRDLRARFDRNLRELAIRELTPRIPQAQRAMLAATGDSSRARFNVIPKSVSLNQVLTLNAQGLSACNNQINIGARVVAISNTAIIVADTANPNTDPLTTADYNSFAAKFDNFVNPLDVDNFGKPSDIDKNGKVVILFTKEVNRLTPANSDGAFIGGFFYERDLFPINNDPQLGLEGCAGSNYGEMFYVLVPDPNGTQGPNGGAGVRHTKEQVLNGTIGTLAHEYQHLINAGRRLYINNAPVFESVWLNEGLSHIAEELAFYKASAGLAPRQNIGISQLQGSVNAFNEFEADNLGRFQSFLGKPALTGAYADNDSLQTRGATWFMLRYLADHRNASDAETWKALVNTTAAGHHNLALVFGSDYMSQIRDWSTTVFSDDLSGVADPRFLEQSWNMRSIFPQICANQDCSARLGVYPLAITSLTNNSTSAQTVVPGGTSYIRFGVAANGQASIDWFRGSLPPNPLMQFSIVRTQ